MKIGYIVNGSHPLLETIRVSEIKSSLAPLSKHIHIPVVQVYKKVLIVGMEEAMLYDPTIPLYDSTFSQQISYCFSESEGKESYDIAINKYLTHCVENVIKDYSFITVSDLSIIKWTSQVFKHETSIGVYIVNSDKEIYYFNKSFMSYFGKDTHLNIPSSTHIIQWKDSFSALLRCKRVFFEQAQIENLLSSYCDVNKFFAAYCMEWSKSIWIYEGKALDVWERAYRVENFLSTLKVKIDVPLLEELSEDNSVCKAVLDNIDSGYVVQHYKGTDKTTGRIFPTGDGFSLQTFPHEMRNLIVAEEDCLLVEFDYQHFEYSLLSQMIGFHLSEDPHKELANLLFKDESKRAIAKTINYGLLYGRSLNTLITELINEHKVQYTKEELITLLKPISEPVEKLSLELQKKFDANGYIVNYYGRDIVPTKRFACVNNYISSTATDYIILKITKIIEYLKQYSPINKIVLQNHDSILLNLSVKDIENTDIALDILNILESEEDSLKTRVDIKYGYNWAFS